MRNLIQLHISKLLFLILAALISLTTAAQAGYSVEYAIKHSQITDLQYSRLIFNDSFAFFYYKGEVDILNGASVFSEKIIHHAALTDKSNNIIYDQVDYPAGNRYLIKDSIKTLEWLPQKGTKIILGYTCYAIKNKKVLVWYTKVLGDGKGFLFYGGLPGLPLQIKDKSRKRTITATGISKGNYKFVLPTAKIVSVREHKQLSRERIKKMGY